MKLSNASRALAASALVLAVSACGNNSQATPPPQATANPASSSYGHVEFSVGTLNLAGQIFLNTVVSVRQPNGLSAYGSDTPAITWDGNFTNNGGAAAGQDNGQKQITGVLPANPIGSHTVPPSTFGTSSTSVASWGAFGYGFVPSNSFTNGGPTSIAQPCLPFFATAVTAPNFRAGTPSCAAGNQFFGGPPAFPQVRNAALAGQLGAFLGFTPFAFTPAANPATGTSVFTLNIAVPTSPVLNLPPVTATISNFAGLPLFATPAFAADAAMDGGATLAYALPAGATEAYIQVVDYGPDSANGSPNCNYGGAPPFFYTLKVTASGTSTLANNLGATPAVGTLPAGKSTHTICTAADNAAAAASGTPVTSGGAAVGTGNPATADQVQVQGIAFDYPAFEAAYPQSSGNPTPTIAGANGQSDISMSDLSPLMTYGDAGAATSIRRR